MTLLMTYLILSYKNLFFYTSIDVHIHQLEELYLFGSYDVQRR